MKIHCQIQTGGAILLLSLGLGLLLYWVSGSQGFKYLLLFSTISGFLVLVICLLRRRIGMIQGKEAFRSGLMRSMNAMLYYRESGLPLLHSIEKSAELAELRELRESLSVLSRRIRLGDTVENSVSVIERLKLVGLDLSAIKTMLSSYEIELRERISEIEAHSQGHATVSMFLSTILPSFVIFAFVGSTIISNAAPSLELFAMAMLVILPMVYSISYAELNKALIGGNGKEKKPVLALAKRILIGVERGSRMKPAIEKAVREEKSGSHLALLLKRHLLGQIEVTIDGQDNPYAAELEKLVAFGLNTGKSIKKSLSLFCRRLEYEVESENRLSAKIGSMRALTYSGLLFFLPLFGGISSSILGTSVSLLNGQMLSFQQHFLMVIAGYVTILLSIVAVLGDPVSGFLKSLYSVAPLALCALLVLLLTAHYATEIL